MNIINFINKDNIIIDHKLNKINKGSLILGIVQLPL